MNAAAGPGPNALFATERHEPLRGEPWSAARVHAAVRSIADELLAAGRDGRGGRFPLHPQDDEGDEPPLGFQAPYLGASGVWWALASLHRAGAIALAQDPATALRSAWRAYREAPDGGRDEASVFVGAAGVLLAQWAVTGDDESADALFAVVQGHADDPARELFWGTPGTMLAAWRLWRASGQPRWRALWQRDATALLATWPRDATGAAGSALWTQHVHGTTVQYLGAGHGWAGCVQALLAGAEALEAPARTALLARVADTLAHWAVVVDGAANWPGGAYTPRAGQPRCLMQWCHGAPGIVCALAAYPRGHDERVDRLLVAAGEAIWRAGPLAKGHGLCHGTAGNGLALLALHEREGGSRWLERARAFAMHALTQREAARAAGSPVRATLWTGDAGLAWMLWQTLEGRAGLPLLERLQ